ncbi:unnamed protein product [Musa acuminata subsp. burmannicoides]
MVSFVVARDTSSARHQTASTGSRTLVIDATLLEPLRPEAVGGVPVPRVSADRPRVDADLCAGSDLVPEHVACLLAGTQQQGGRRVQPQCLLDDALEVVQLVESFSLILMVVPVLVEMSLISQRVSSFLMEAKDRMRLVLSSSMKQSLCSCFQLGPKGQKAMPEQR